MNEILEQKPDLKVNEIADETEVVEMKETIDSENGLKISKHKNKNICFYCEKPIDFIIGLKHDKSRYKKCNDCIASNVKKKMKFMERICNFCGKKYTTTYYTKQGVLETKRKKYKCDECKCKKIPKGPLPRPKLSLFECDFCGKQYNTKTSIYHHMDNHRSDVTCKVCGATFSKRNTLRIHLRSHFEMYICELCGFSTNKSIAFKNHLKIHDLGEVSTSTPQKKKSYKPPKKSNFHCSNCGLIFNTQAALFNHEKRQHSEDGVNGFNCKYCGTIFYRMKEYRIHVMSHSNKQLLFCTFPSCEMFFDTVKKLNAHFRNVHEPRNEFQCPKCEKSFKYQRSVDKHLKNNRCIPLSERKMASAKSANTKTMDYLLKNKNAQELEEIAKIAKEQYVEVRGLTKIIEEEKDDKDVFKEDIVDKPICVTKIEPISSDDDDCDNGRYDDTFIRDDYSPDNSAVVKNESDPSIIPLIKIEIKSEPSDNSIFNESWTNVKTDPDNLNPIVLLDRLDYDKLMRLEKIKVEDDFYLQNYFTTQEDTTKLKSSKAYKRSAEKMLKMTKFMKRKHKGVHYTCDYCGLNFVWKLYLKEHFIEHRKIWKQNTNKCSVCSESFLKASLLRAHLKDVHNIEQFSSYTCDLCGKVFKQNACLRSHLKFTHKTTLDFECSQCPQKFKSKNFLMRHISDVHDKIYKFSCQYCAKQFKRKDQVKTHELRHGAPMTCEICGKMVKLLSEHMKIVHNNDQKEKELLSCGICGKFISKYNMQAHINKAHHKLHTEKTKDRPCLKCSQVFTRKDDLRRHELLTHHQGVLKSCPYADCNGIFKTTKLLNSHVREVHERAAESIFCGICGKAFSSSSGLLKHTKNKHK